MPGRQDRYGDRAGLPLPVLKSRQWELGLRGSREQFDWSLAWFDIDRPAVTDAPPEYRIDGSNHHRGLEGSLAVEAGAWTLRGGAIWIDAQREGAEDPTANGLTPANVPRHTLKLQSGYRVAGVPGLALQAGLVHEGRRFVLPDNSIALPSWTRVDAGASLQQRLRGQHADLAPGHRQPLRPTRLEGVAPAVRPCVPVPARVAHPAADGAGRPVTPCHAGGPGGPGARRSAMYNRGLFPR